MSRYVSVLAMFIFFLAGCSGSQEESSAKIPELQKIMEGRRWSITAISCNKAIDFNNSGEKSNDILSQILLTIKEFDLLEGNKLRIITPDNGDVARNKNGEWKVNDSIVQLTFPDAKPVNFNVVEYRKTEVIIMLEVPFNREKVNFTYTLSRIDP